MADEIGTERPDPATQVTASSGGPVEWTSGVREDARVNVEWATVLGGLPDLSPEEAMDPKRPVIKLVMSRSEMLQFADSLSGLVERFRP